MQRTGYYEPSNPKNITEYQPQKPVLGGVLFFIPGVVLLIFGVVVLRNRYGDDIYHLSVFCALLV